MTSPHTKASLLLGGAWLFSLSGAAGAQTAPVTPAPPLEQSATTEPSDDFGDEEAIVVTGAKPPGSVIGDIPPEKILDARDVRATGATSITELLDALAPEIGSARGRGGERPVLLLNGQRISSFREMRDIPTEAIQRVEILPEEVALKYGYRADQRVVNIVLRQRFRSTTATLGGALATDGGYASGTADLTRFQVEKKGRTTYNLHAAGNGMLTENERDIRVDPAQIPPSATEQDVVAARSLLGTSRQVRGGATFNRQLGQVSATLNTEVEHDEGRSLIGLNPTLLDPLDRRTTTNSAHAGVTLNGTTKGQWKWNITGNADWARDTTASDRDDVSFPRDRARETRTSGDITGTANGTLFKLPAGNAGATVKVGASTEHLDGESTRLGVETPSSLGRTTGTASINLDLPISRRNREFSALGNLTLNANAEVDQVSDFGTLTTIGAGVNWSPVDRLNLITSWTREEGAPTIQQLGDPQLTTENTRIFDFTTGQTVLVTATTGGNPNLLADRRNVFKIGGNWQPFEKVDLRLRADYVHQRIENPISNISVTPQLEQAFPERFVCDTPSGVCDGTGPLVSVDLTPINFDSSKRETLRIGFDFSKPLKSRRPSQATIDQMRAQFRNAIGGGGRGGSPRAQQGQNTPAPPAAEGAPPPPPADGPGGGGFGGRGFGGGRGGAGGGGGLFGGGNRGRLTFSLTDTITFVDKTQIAPGLELDYLHGDAIGSSGGTPRHAVEAQAGYFNNGIGARVSANWRSGTHVDTLAGDTLRFSPLATFDLRLFANPGDIPEVAVKHPWLRGTQVRFEVINLFDAKPRVHDAAGDVPFNYQPDLLNPLGRTIGITIRKLFLPPPSFFRRVIQERQQQNGKPG